MKEVTEAKPAGRGGGNRSRMRENTEQRPGSGKSRWPWMPDTSALTSWRRAAGDVQARIWKREHVRHWNGERALYGAEREKENVMAWSLRHQEKKRGPVRARGEKEGCCEDARIPEASD